MSRLFLAAMLSLAPALTLAQEGSWVQVERRELLAGGRTADAVKHDALYGALAEAVRQVAGVKVQASEVTMRRESRSGLDDHYVQAVRLDAAGHAIEWRVVREGWKTEKSRTLGDQVYYELSLRVNVERERGTRDPGFEATLALNSPPFVVRSEVLRENDEVVATVATTVDASLTIVSIVDDSATVLVPNDVMPPVRTAAGRPREVPLAADRANGVHFRVTLPAGVNSRTQVLAVVATRRPIPLPADRGEGVARDSRTLSLASFNRWLVGIPLEDRAVAQAAFQVQRAP